MCPVDKTVEQLTTDQIKKIILETSPTKPFLVFTGGEPFMREDLSELISYAYSLGLKGTIITNGTILNKKIIASALKFSWDFMISLDGSCPEINDKIRGQGSFQKTIETLDYLNDKKKDSLIKMTFIIQDENVADIYNICKLAELKNIDELHFEFITYFKKNLSKNSIEILKEEFEKYLSGGYYIKPKLDVFNEEFDLFAFLIP